jgi:hypothetical protein
MKKKVIILFLTFVVLSFLPKILMASTAAEYEGELIVGTPILEQGSLVAIIFRIIQYILAFLGVIAMAVMLYGGFTWMTAGGNDEKVGKAKKTLMAGLIGLVIILLAYAIATFVIARIHEFAKK